VTDKVDDFMRSLKHDRKDEVQIVRELVLTADPRLSEQIKWNAPSFGIDGDDRMTFRLQPGDRVQLIFDRGVKKRDAETFVFEDELGLLDWVAKDRAVVTFADSDHVAREASNFQDLVKRWIRAISD